jgi:hypothetical protein
MDAERIMPCHCIRNPRNNLIGNRTSITGTVLARDMRLRKLFCSSGRGLLFQLRSPVRTQSAAAMRESCLVSGCFSREVESVSGRLQPVARNEPLLASLCCHARVAGPGDCPNGRSKFADHSRPDSALVEAENLLAGRRWNIESVQRREFDNNGRSTSIRIVIRAYHSTMRINNTAADGQPEARATFFRCNERIK